MSYYLLPNIKNIIQPEMLECIIGEPNLVISKFNCYLNNMKKQIDQYNLLWIVIKNIQMFMNIYIQ